MSELADLEQEIRLLRGQIRDIGDITVSVISEGGGSGTPDAATTDWIGVLADLPTLGTADPAHASFFVDDFATLIGFDVLFAEVNMSASGTAWDWSYIEHPYKNGVFGVVTGPQTSPYTESNDFLGAWAAGKAAGITPHFPRAMLPRAAGAAHIGNRLAHCNLTNGSATVDAASGTPFVAGDYTTGGDVGRPLHGSGIPADSYIGVVHSSTSIGLSSSQSSNVPVAATSNQTNVTVTVNGDMGLGSLGFFDAHWTALANSLLAAGLGDAIIRLGSEFNLGLNDVSTALQFVGYWKNVVNAMRAVSPDFRFFWCPARGGSSPTKTTIWNTGNVANFGAWYPDGKDALGKTFVDIIGLDFYNQYEFVGQDWLNGNSWIGAHGGDTYTNGRAHTGALYELYGLDWLTRFVAQKLADNPDMKIAFGEWGISALNAGGQGDQLGVTFIQNFSQWVADNQVYFACYFEDGSTSISLDKNPLSLAEAKNDFGPYEPQPPKPPPLPANVLLGSEVNHVSFATTLDGGFDVTLPGADGSAFVPPIFSLRRDSNDGIVAGDNLGVLGFGGFYGARGESLHDLSAYFYAYARGDWDDDNAGSGFQWWATPGSSVTPQKLGQWTTQGVEIDTTYHQTAEPVSQLGTSINLLVDSTIDYPGATSTPTETGVPFPRARVNLEGGVTFAQNNFLYGAPPAFQHAIAYWQPAGGTGVVSGQGFLNAPQIFSKVPNGRMPGTAQNWPGFANTWELGFADFSSFSPDPIDGDASLSHIQQVSFTAAGFFNAGTRATRRYGFAYMDAHNGAGLDMQPTTVVGGFDTASLPSTITLTTAAGFDTSSFFGPIRRATVVTSDGIATIHYTGVSGNQLTGCTLLTGTGTVADLAPISNFGLVDKQVGLVIGNIQADGDTIGGLTGALTNYGIKTRISQGPTLPDQYGLYIDTGGTDPTTTQIGIWNDAQLVQNGAALFTGDTTFGIALQSADPPVVDFTYATVIGIFGTAIELYQNGVTFTGAGSGPARPHFLYCDTKNTDTPAGGIVLNNASGGADMGDFLEFSPTVTLKKSGAAFGLAAGLNFDPTFVNDPGVAANFTSIYAFISQYNVRADTQSVAGGTGKEVWLKPAYETVNGGHISSGTHDHLTIDLTVGAGATLSQRRGIVINSALVSGTLTTEVALDVWNAGVPVFRINQNGTWFSGQQGAVVGADFWVGPSFTPATDAWLWVDASAATTFFRGTVDFSDATIVGGSGGGLGGDALLIDGSTNFDASGASGLVPLVMVDAPPILGLGRVNGPDLAWTHVLANQVLGQLKFLGKYDDVAPDNIDTSTANWHLSAGGQIFGQATQDWTATAHGGKLLFQTVPNDTTTLLTALTLGHDQSATFAGLATFNAGALVTGGLLVLTGGILCNSATVGVGYGTGAGSAVTQATSKSTGVTMNRACGRITMNSAALANGISVTFTLTNSSIAATDVIIINVTGNATAGTYLVGIDNVQAGSCRIHLRNVSANSRSEAVILQFAVFKSVTS